MRMSVSERIFKSKETADGALAIDWWVLNDADSAGVPSLFGDERVRFSEKLAVFIDHDTPCGSVEAALLQKELIAFAERQGAVLFNGQGVSYQLMLDRFVREGEVVATCSPHAPLFGAVGALGVTLSPEAFARSLLEGTCRAPRPETVCVVLESPPAVSAKDVILNLIGIAGDSLKGRSVAFVGEGAAALTLSERIVICQLINETGALSAFFPDGPMPEGTAPLFAIDLSTVSPMIAGPNTPRRVLPARELQGLALDEVFIGGCSGGRIEDLRAAAKILKGGKVAHPLRLLVAPATTEAFVQAADEGLLTTFMDAGAIVMNQGCSVCWGRSQGIVDAGETLLSSGSRCFPGAAGSEAADIYLCSPVVAAFSALAGKISVGED